MSKDKFYHFRQTNSGGYFVTDKAFGVGNDVIIQAGSADQAWVYLKAIGDKVVLFWFFCLCCGERWPELLEEGRQGTAEPEIAGEKLDEASAVSWRKDVVVHYADKTFKWFELRVE